MRSIIRVLVNAFALWLTTIIVGGAGDHGFWIVPFASDTWGHIGTLMLVALVFGLVNATLGRVLRAITGILYLITLGLFGLIVNGVLVWVIAWLSDLVGFGLHVDGFWWGVLGALVLSVLSGLMNALLGTRKERQA